MFNNTSMNPKYTAPITVLALMLNKRNIPCTCTQIFDGLQLRFPWCEGNIICHGNSCGHSEGHVESYNFPWDNGWFTELTVTAAVELLTVFYAKNGD